MRKLERQLRVLPDLLNSCSDIASKVTRVRTLANMLAAAPLASSMFSEVDKLVRIYLTIPVTTATAWGKVPFCRPMHQNLPEICYVQQRLNNIMLLSVHKDLTDMDWICPPSPGSSWTPMNAACRHFFGTVHSPQWNPPERLRLTLGTVRLELFGNLTIAFIFVYSLLQTVMCIIVLQWAWAFMSLAKHVHVGLDTSHSCLGYTCRCINWLLTYFEMSSHTRHYFSA